MLTDLRITDLGVIAEAVLEPGPGFTAVTGETGAGKTMVVTGLSLLLGARAEAGLIRRGATRCVVEGTWRVNDEIAAELADLGAETEAGELLVARQIGQSRSRALVGSGGAAGSGGPGGHPVGHHPRAIGTGPAGHGRAPA